MNTKRKILFIEPFYASSHKVMEDQLQKYSRHDIKLLTLPGRHWKWRMHGAAITLATEFLNMDYTPDLIIATDMIDLSTFVALARKKIRNIPVVLFFHENQLTYPWSATDPDTKLNRDRTYAWINYTSSLAADRILFNSRYHMQSFISAIPDFLYAFPDFRNHYTIEYIEAKSSVLYIGMELKTFYTHQKRINKVPIVLWNHRWEYDKCPETFFECLYRLSESDENFELIVCGESYKKYPAVFNEAEKRLAKHIIHFGYAESKDRYIQLVQSSDILPVTNDQDFFGISIVEAIAAGVMPLLPNKLSYPEHVDPVDNPQCFYNDSDDLYQKLKAMIQDWPNQLPSLADHVMHYDWSNIIESYDRKFEDAINNN